MNYRILVNHKKLNHAYAQRDPGEILKVILEIWGYRDAFVFASKLILFYQSSLPLSIEFITTKILF